MDSLLGQLVEHDEIGVQQPLDAHFSDEEKPSPEFARVVHAIVELSKISAFSEPAGDREEDVRL